MRRVLDARTYDALKAGAEQFGGIGYGLLFEDMNHEPERRDASDSRPLSVWGIVAWMMRGPGEAHPSLIAVQRPLQMAGLLTNECALDAIQRIIVRRRIPEGPNDPHPRVTFQDYCDEIGLERGEDTPFEDQ